MAEDHFRCHDGPKSMTGDAVALGKREQMNESRPPVPVLRRVEQTMRRAGGNEIPVCFVEDEGDVPGLGELCERTQEVWRIGGTGLQVRSESRS